MGPLIFLNTFEKFTLGLGLQWFNTIGERIVVNFGTKQQYLMAATVIACMPSVVVYLLAQRHFVRGIIMSGVKGQLLSTYEHRRRPVARFKRENR